MSETTTVVCSSAHIDSMVALGELPLLRICHDLARVVHVLASEPTPLGNHEIAIAESAARQAIHYWHMAQKARALEAVLAERRATAEHQDSESCWCEPTVEDYTGTGGAKLIIHRTPS